ncbi:glycosyltransferase family A protein [Lentisphaera profundi]|uniref:Glycosyltransferase family A protein n=1 Tax=Lentisphaera profundi TaxID=1658616 RepID=A0ABY7VVT6_9BACT|nr:glycosyltransferase family A protein [Lentisphaera profundi]WDE98192.1 glycosyltransferase family A protein [Lentisphaera profundi]
MTSIIITAFNYEKYLERAIRSAIKQSIKDYEIIVVNDCSTDRTKEILDNYTDEVRVYNLEKNVGLSAARNFGLRKAKGQFVTFLDADDYIHSDLLYTSSLFLYENNDLDAISVDYHLVDERGNHIEMINADKSPIACGILFRKDQLFEIGLYDECFLAREEEDLRIRFLKKYKITRIPIPLYRYRMHQRNLTKDDKKMDVFKDQLERKHV